ncbi:unnamed protein product [Calicophoron daubneyi]|uniref:Peptidase A1 domain-containing protein n=1 Tax=Calicophoron daubneyi TaxID=300641 RepID=A0AAV2TMR4_CALDB
MNLWVLFSLILALSSELSAKKRGVRSEEVSSKTVHVLLQQGHDGLYYGVVNIGTPGQMFKIFFDPIAVNMWVPSSKCDSAKYPTCGYHAKYNGTKSNSSHPTSARVNFVSFSASVTGNVTSDVIQLASTNTISQHFVEADEISGALDNNTSFDGIIGLGSSRDKTDRPTVLESLKEQGLINKATYSMYLNGSNGEILFGGENHERYVGEMVFAKLLPGEMWSFKPNNVTFGRLDLCGSGCTALANVGSRHIYGPPKFIEAINEAMKCDPSQGLCEVHCSKLDELPDFRIIIASKEFVLTPKQYIRRVRKGSTEICQSPFAALGIDFWFLGDVFLKTVYTEYDVEEQQIGFAHLRNADQRLYPTLGAIILVGLSSIWLHRTR